MSTLTLRKKRNLGNCITKTSLNPKTKRYYFDETNPQNYHTWNVEDFTKQNMENGNTIINIDHKELMEKLQVFDTSTSIEEINKLLQENQGDFISVMNILKEKNSKMNLMQRKKSKNVLKGNLLKEKILKKLRKRKTKERREDTNKEEIEIKLENSPHVMDKSSPKSSYDSEVNQKVMTDRILTCHSKEDVEDIVHEIADGYNNIVKQLKRSKSENYILMMGIQQRRDITRKEIKKRIEVEKELKETQLKLGQLIQSQNQLQQSFNGGWMQNHFGREGF